VTGEHDHGCRAGRGFAPQSRLRGFPGERENNEKTRSEPAQETRSVTGGIWPAARRADDGVAGPAQRGDGEQQVGLVWRARPPGAGASALRSEADMERSFLARVHDAAAPARCQAPGRNFLPGPASQDTDFHRTANGRRMHRVHASGTPGTRHGCAFRGLAAFDRQHVLLGGGWAISSRRKAG